MSNCCTFLNLCCRLVVLCIFINLIRPVDALAGKDNDSCLPSIEVEFSDDGLSVYVESSKDLSNVVLQFCDGTRDYKFDNLNQPTGTFSSDGKFLNGVWVKSGCNGTNDDDLPGYGEFFDTDCPECEEGIDECGVCGGSGKNECGVCDNSIVPDECGVCGGPGKNECGSCDESLTKDECGVCGGPGEGPCGCDLSITRDECGVCGGPGEDECGLCPNQEGYNQGPDECGVCGGPGKNECDSCDQSVVKDECGVCGGPGKNECDSCDQSVVKDECGVCGGPGKNECDSCNPNVVKDACGVCGGPGEGPCGCNTEITRDECGICGGPGKNECGSCDQSVVKDECGVCGGNGPGECGCNTEQTKDECGVCGGNGPGECGCDETVKKDECGICGGSGKDQCGICPEEQDYNKGKDYCGRCPQDIEYGSDDCLDCAGIPFGTHSLSITGECCEYDALDICGECNGPGPNECGCRVPGPGECGCDETVKKDECGVCGGRNECLCQEQETPVELDILSNKLLRLAIKAVRSYRSKLLTKKGFVPKAIKEELIALTASLKDIHNDTWISVWGDFGAKVIVCPDETLCENKDLTSLIKKIENNFDLLYSAAEKYSNMTSKLAKSRKNKLLVKAIEARKDAGILITWLPVRKTICN